MLKEGITDSKIYLKEVLKYLDSKVIHLSIAIECKHPKISPKINDMRRSLSTLLSLEENSIRITATSGEELTEFGKVNVINVFACITVE